MGITAGIGCGIPLHTSYTWKVGVEDFLLLSLPLNPSRRLHQIIFYTSCRELSFRWFPFLIGKFFGARTLFGTINCFLSHHLLQVENIVKKVFDIKSDFLPISTTWNRIYYFTLLPIACSVLQFSLHSVLLVITLTYFSYLFGQTLLHWIISHYPWHICWLTSTFVPRFTLQTLCPAYLNNPQFPYKYQTWSLVHSNLFLPIQK